jgi:hypothetical protein
LLSCLGKVFVAFVLSLEYLVHVDVFVF